MSKSLLSLIEVIEASTIALDTQKLPVEIRVYRAKTSSANVARKHFPSKHDVPGDKTSFGVYWIAEAWRGEGTPEMFAEAQGWTPEEACEQLAYIVASKLLRRTEEIQEAIKTVQRLKGEG